MMSNALLVRHYETPIDTLALLQASRQWADIARAQVPTIEAPKTSLGAGAKNRLRIGFVSGDLCAHSVGFLIAPSIHAYPDHMSSDLEQECRGFSSLERHS
jgi:predicted O-linked N-acetylglucosamine transferase (SPINDLY family)